MITRTTVWLSLGIGLAACGGVDLGTVEQEAACHRAFCGGNDPIIDVFNVHDINLDGVANSEDFTVLGFSQDHQFYGLEVRDGKVLGTDASGATVLQGHQLVGTRIWLDRLGTQYAIEITGVGTTQEVVAPRGTLETYVLAWTPVLKRELSGPPAPGSLLEQLPELGSLTAVCSAPPDWGSGRSEWDESSVMTPFDALVFEGDRIDASTRRVNAVADDRWFNIGCASHTLAKLRLTRNTIHTAKGWQNVQAAVKMLSADYCDTGLALTIPGQPLVWRDRGGMKYLQRPRELEARWDENGAICVNIPRLASPAVVARHCPKLPACANLDTRQWDGPLELITSGNYD